MGGTIVAVVLALCLIAGAIWLAYWRARVEQAHWDEDLLRAAERAKTAAQIAAEGAKHATDPGRPPATPAELRDALRRYRLLRGGKPPE